jgi:hypothetical protein
MANTFKLRPIPAPEAQLQALTYFLDGTAADLGGVRLVPGTIAKVLNYKASQYRGILPRKVTDVWNQMPSSELKRRYEMFLEANPEFPGLFRNADFKADFIRNGVLNDGSAVLFGAITSPIELYKRALSADFAKNGAQNQRTHMSQFNTLYELPYYISILNALLVPMQGAANGGAGGGGGGGYRGGARRRRTTRRRKSKRSKTRRNRRV